MDNMTSGNRVARSVKRIPRVAWLVVAIILALAAAIGASLLLSHSLIRPVQRGQEQIRAATLEQQGQLAKLAQDIAAQEEQLRTVQDKMQHLSDSPANVRELTSLQKEKADREKLYGQQLTQLKLQLNQIENAHEIFGKNVDKARSELERENKALRDDLQALQSSLNDMKNKIQQLERQVSAR